MRNLSASRLPIVVGLILASVWSPGRAEDPVNIIPVTTTVDSLDAFDQQCSLREALRNANKNTQSSPVLGECPAGSGSMTDVILLQHANDYHLTLPGEGDDAGDLDILNNNPDLAPALDDLRIEISGGSPAPIRQTVQGQRVIENHQARTTLKDVSIAWGEAVSGGGIYNAGGAMVLEDVNVGVNDAAGDGGGLYNDGDMTIRGGDWYSNAAGNFGGSIYHANGTMRLIDLDVQTSQAIAGGGIFNTAQLTIESDSLFHNNNVATSHGGGIANAGSGSLTVSDSTIEHGKADVGGGIANTDDARLILSNTVVRANEASQRGGERPAGAGCDIGAYEKDVSLLLFADGFE